MRQAGEPGWTLKKAMSSTAALVVLGAIEPLPALAQEATDEPSVQETVVVTGSFLRRDASDSASPLSIVGRESLEDQGVANPIDFVKFLTINNGSDFNADLFAAGGQAGTAQYNLRGLGLASTLVLLNGRRTTLSGADGNENLSFVDVNTLLPNIMIERVEILKDGASSLYGSDAVAGVVNHITRDRHVGGDIVVDYRRGQGDQETYQVDALYGWDLGRTNLVLAASYVDQGALLASELDFATVSSGVGSPGAFFPLAASGAPVGGPRSDPLCGVVAGTPSSFPGGPGVCSFDLAPFTDVVTDDDRFLAMLSVRHDLDNGTELFADFNYSTRETERNGAPSFPGLRTITVPLDHPRIGDAPTFGVPSPPLAQLRYFGRPLGTGFEPRQSILEDDYARVSAGLRGDWGEVWSYEAAITYGTNDFTSTSRSDVLFDELQAAINSGAFNPFATALNGVAPNDPAVIESFRADLVEDVESSVFTLDGVLTRDLFEMAGGTVGLALGAQYRANDRTVDRNDLANAERFFFLVGGPDTDGDIGAYAAFAEIALPVTDWMEIQAALRYESYDNDAIGDSVDPKVAVLIRPNDILSFRGSYSTAFRAPQVGQIADETVSVGAVFDPVPGAVVFAPVRTTGNPDLEPEQAETLNLGFTLQPNDALTFSADYWSFEYEDLITTESASGIVAAALANPAGDPRVIRSAGGTLQEVRRSLVNAPSLETDGLDFMVRLDTQIPNLDVDFSIIANATHILTYELVFAPGQPAQDLSGSRNYTNSGFANPDWRGNVTIAAEKGPIRGTLTSRYIGEFTNDSGANPGETIDSWTIYDGQVTLNLADTGLGDFDRVRPFITLGATNIFNEEPPFADTSNAFPIATRVHDPRGRTVYVRLGTRF